MDLNGINSFIVRRTCIVLEYCPFGEMVRILLSLQNNISEGIVLNFFKQMVKGMLHLKSKEAHHLDLKPDNIFVSDDFTLKIADFGFGDHPSIVNKVKG